MATTDSTKKKATTPRAPRARKPKEAVEGVKEEKQVQDAAVETASTVDMPAPKSGSYISALGRRKTALARVRLMKTGKGNVSVNGSNMQKYFPTFELSNIVKSPLNVVGLETAVDVSALIQGGGSHAQAEALRLGIARALIELNPTYRKTLKKLGFLTRDPRAKERKKPGLKRARRSPQWSKR